MRLRAFMCVYVRLYAFMCVCVALGKLNRALKQQKDEERINATTYPKNKIESKKYVF